MRTPKPAQVDWVLWAIVGYLAWDAHRLIAWFCFAVAVTSAVAMAVAGYLAARRGEPLDSG